PARLRFATASDPPPPGEGKGARYTVCASAAESATICKQQRVVACSGLIFLLERLFALRCIARPAPFLFNDFKQPGVSRAATCCIAVIRRTCIFVDIYKRASRSRRTAAAITGRGVPLLPFAQQMAGSPRSPDAPQHAAKRNGAALIR